jgi:DNA-binding NarL/FixJ family response regulator
MKILLVDDHTLVRAGLKHVLAQLDPAVQVIEAGGCAEALAAARAHRDLALALLDLHMPDGNGLTVLKDLTRDRPTLLAVVLSGSDKREDMQRALDAGAMGFIPKTATAPVMLGALRLVLAGGIYVPPEMVQTMGGRRSDTDSAGHPELTPRQLDVLARAIDGKPNKVIARELGLTEATVKAHIAAVLRALNVSNRTEAAQAASRLGIKLPRQ